MAMTTTDTRQPDTTTPALPVEPTTGLGGLFVWVAVAVALVAATVLGLRVFSSDDDTAPQPWYSVEHGSIAAIDHAAQAAAIADQPSIAAADHAAATPSAARTWYSEHGSVTAIDHAAATPSAARTWYSEHGSITALDYEAHADETETG